MPWENVWKWTRVLSLSLKMTPHVCLEMTLVFLGPKMMSLAVKMDSKVLCVWKWPSEYVWKWPPPLPSQWWWVLKKGMICFLNELNDVDGFFSCSTSTHVTFNSWMNWMMSMVSSAAVQARTYHFFFKCDIVFLLDSRLCGCFPSDLVSQNYQHPFLTIHCRWPRFLFALFNCFVAGGMIWFYESKTSLQES